MIGQIRFLLEIEQIYDQLIIERRSETVAIHSSIMRFWFKYLLAVKGRINPIEV